MTEKDLISFSKQQIQKGSKSFAMASFFFKEQERAAAWLLYSWCRYVDDLIDKAPSKTEALKALRALEEQTKLCFTNETPDSSPMRGMQIVVRQFSIPLKYPLDMLRGMRMDVEGFTYNTLAELEDYCYCVAGTVGLMMSHIMGISSQEALQDAVAMGNAMQMTNIARDVKEDLEMGRIYFPSEWLQQFDLTKDNFSQHTTAWPAITRQLLREADKNYQNGWAGLQFLPFRAAWAVGVAGEVYRRIGTKVRARGPKAWDKRCYTTTYEKLWVVVSASTKLFFRFLPRLWKPYSPQTITSVWGQS